MKRPRYTLLTYFYYVEKTFIVDKVKTLTVIKNKTDSFVCPFKVLFQQRMWMAIA